MTWPGPGDDLAPDVISSGGEDPGVFWRVLRFWLRSLLRLVWVRWAAGVALAGAIAAVIVVAPWSAHPVAKGSHPPLGPRLVPAFSISPAPVSPVSISPVSISSVMTGKVTPGGVFAGGGAGGRTWQMAVQNIAGSGSGSGVGAWCQPAVTVNGNFADPLFPDPPMLTPVGNPAFMTLGSRLPGVGFAFMQVPAVVTWTWLEPDGIGGLSLGMQPVTISMCGKRFYLVGFAYPLTGTLRIHVSSADAQASYTVPSVLSAPQPWLDDPQIDGVWQDLDAARGRVATATLAAGGAPGGHWSIRVTFGTAGDCFAILSSLIDDSANAQPEQMSGCAPVSTPNGPDTIMALPLGMPAPNDQGTGYALSVSPQTARLVVRFADGTAKSVTPVEVAGRRYAAFYVPASVPLRSLAWINSAGREFATLRALPQYGYTQFRP